MQRNCIFWQLTSDLKLWGKLINAPPKVLSPGSFYLGSELFNWGFYGPLIELFLMGLSMAFVSTRRNVFNGSIPACFYLFSSFRRVQILKTLEASWNPTWIVRAVGQNAYTYSNSTTLLVELLMGDINRRGDLVKTKSLFNNSWSCSPENTRRIVQQPGPIRISGLHYTIKITTSYASKEIYINVMCHIETYKAPFDVINYDLVSS